jgi:hypothetical protein
MVWAAAAILTVFKTGSHSHLSQCPHVVAMGARLAKAIHGKKSNPDDGRVAQAL